MDVRISVGGDESDDALLSLGRWLRDDLGRDVEVRPVPATGQPGDMGAGIDLLQAVVTDGIALGSLVVAVMTWRGTRSRRTAVRIEHNDTVVVIEGGSAEEVSRVVELLSGQDQAGS